MVRLRRLAEALEATGRDPARGMELMADALWLARAIRRYDAEAPTGLDLAHALGLRPAAGQEHWFTIEARQRRNDLLRQAAVALGDLGVRAAAEEIRREAARNARRARPPADGPGALIAEAGRARPIPTSARAIKEILEAKSPVLISMDTRETAPRLGRRP